MKQVKSQEISKNKKPVLNCPLSLKSKPKGWKTRLENILQILNNSHRYNNSNLCSKDSLSPNKKSVRSNKPHETK